MYLLLFIVLLLSIFVMLAFTRLSTVAMQLDTDRNDFHFLFYWLYPLLKSRVEFSNYRPLLTVYLFNIRVFSKVLRANKKKKQKQPVLDYYHALDLRNLSMKASYGLGNPFTTGIFAGTIGLFAPFLRNAEIVTYPDFFSAGDYISVQASAKMNIGNTVLSMLRLKRKNKM